MSGPARRDERAGQALTGLTSNVWDLADTIDPLARSGQPVDRAQLAEGNLPLENSQAGARS